MKHVWSKPDPLRVRIKDKIRNSGWHYGLIVGAILWISSAILLLTGCDAFLDVRGDRPPQCGTTERGEAWSAADSALVDAEKIYICRETVGGWEVKHCWFPIGEAENMTLTCEVLHGWHRGGGGDWGDEDSTYTGVGIQ